MVYAPDKSLDAGFMLDYTQQVREAEKKLVELSYSEAIAVAGITNDIAIMLTPWMEDMTEADFQNTEYLQYLKVFVIGQVDSIVLNCAGYKYLLPDGYQRASEWVENH